MGGTKSKLLNEIDRLVTIISTERDKFGTRECELMGRIAKLEDELSGNGTKSEFKRLDIVMKGKMAALESELAAAREEIQYLKDYRCVKPKDQR